MQEMRSFKILSKQKLDLGILVGRYRDVGNAYLRAGVLTIDDRNGLTFHIDPTASEAPFKDYEPEQLARLRALVGRPAVALLQSESSPMINLALSRFPVDGVFIENEHRVIFTVKEIQRRQQLGQDWENVGKA